MFSSATTGHRVSCIDGEVLNIAYHFDPAGLPLAGSAKGFAL
jgi:hypothetical protein